MTKAPASRQTVRFAFDTTVAVVLIAALAAIFPAASARADWLVTNDGERIETDGPWELKGRLLIFTRTDGSLSSIRASEIDLEASEAATAEAKAAAMAPPVVEEPVYRPSVMSLTEKDLPPVGRPRTDETSSDTAAPSDTAAAAQGLQITSAQDASQPGSERLEFFGTVRNSSAETMIGVRVTVMLYDEQDQLVAQQEARVSSRALASNQSLSFRALFDSVYNYDRVEYQVNGGPVVTENLPAEPISSEEVNDDEAS